MDLLVNITADVWYALVIAMLFVCCAIHLTAALVKNKNASIVLRYVNVSLHILAFLVLLLAEVKIEAAVLFYMASVFFHTLAGFLGYELSKRKEGSGGDNP